MPSTYNFTTGPSTLPAVGILSYNGCVFSPLFETSINGKVIQDDAKRTTKYMEYDLVVDGFVTLPDNATSTQNTTKQLRQLLTAQAGILIYSGRGIDLKINVPGTLVKDAAWGPMPEVLDLQTLGAGRSAKIKWRVKVCVPEIASTGIFSPVLQFCEEVSVGYGEDGYSSLNIQGILEIPLTRPLQPNRFFDTTVDNFSTQYLNIIAAGIDLTRFRVTRREFTVSKDRRTINWSFAAEELPPQGLPADMTMARGSFNFRPSKAGVGLCNWLCTLRVTYTVKKTAARREAWLAFLILLRLRMDASRLGLIPTPDGPQNPGLQALNTLGNVAGSGLIQSTISMFQGVALWRRLVERQNQNALALRRAWLIEFSGDEGLYLDSKTMTFSATWKLVTTFDRILVASGLWRYVPSDGGNTWATNIRGISGAQSWLRNPVNPDVIVDFGGG